MSRRVLCVGTIRPDRVRLTVQSPGGPLTVSQPHRPGAGALTRLFRLVDPDDPKN